MPGESDNKVNGVFDYVFYIWDFILEAGNSVVEFISGICKSSATDGDADTSLSSDVKPNGSSRKNLQVTEVPKGERQEKTQEDTSLLTTLPLEEPKSSGADDESGSDKSSSNISSIVAVVGFNESQSPGNSSIGAVVGSPSNSPSLNEVSHIKIPQTRQSSEILT